jgi:hypothetical protein
LAGYCLECLKIILCLPAHKKTIGASFSERKPLLTEKIDKLFADTAVVRYHKSFLQSRQKNFSNLAGCGIVFPQILLQ